MGKSTVAIIVFLGALLVFGIAMSVRQSTQFTRACEAKGGTARLAGGHVFETDYLCFDSDGKEFKP